MASTEKKRLSLPTGIVPSKQFNGLLMTSFALPERPRSRRAKYPKVRTGCVSCKKRHVKCDETKPSCNRCLKWSGVCGGYEPSRSKSCPAKNAAAAGRTRGKPSMSRPSTLFGGASPAILALDEGVTPSLTGSEPGTPPPPPPPPLQTCQPPDYLSKQSDLCYNGSNSMENIEFPIGNMPNTTAIGNANDISILDATFWTDTVPRLVRENLAVRYANMAVHILILAKQPELILQASSTSSSSSSSSPPPDLGADHYSLALAHYGLALKQMRHSNEMRGGIRAAVLCSMLFVVFEALNGDRDAAESHLLCGQRMLDELQALLRPNGAGAPPPPAGAGSLRRELRNLLQYISLQVRIGGVTCWKGEFDALCAEYLEDYVTEESYDASPGYGTPESCYMSMAWPEDNWLPEDGLENFTF